MSCEQPTLASVTSNSQAMLRRSMVVKDLILNTSLINMRDKRLALNLAIPGHMLFRPISVVAHDHFFNMYLFLSGVLTGSQVKQQRHMRQARIIQAAIQERWGINNPWRWKLKNFLWLINVHLESHADSSRNYYLLTIDIIIAHLENPS